jgi:hypothetical protein
MVSVGGFEPPISCIRGRHYTLLAPTPGLEPGLLPLGEAGAIRRCRPNWSGWDESNARSPAPKAGALAAALHPDNSGAHEGDRTLLQPVDSRWHSPECDVREMSRIVGAERDHPTNHDAKEGFSSHQAASSPIPFLAPVCIRQCEPPTTGKPAVHRMRLGASSDAVTVAVKMVGPQGLEP